MTSRMTRPTSLGSFVVISRSPAAVSASDDGGAYSTRSTETISRGLPPISTLKSASPRPPTMAPLRSSTVASTTTTSASVRKRGVGRSGGCGCAGGVWLGGVWVGGVWASRAAAATTRAAALIPNCRRRSPIRGTIALPRPHLAALAGADLQCAPAAVGRRARHVGQDVLMGQLFENRPERGVEILGPARKVGAAAAGFGERLQRLAELRRRAIAEPDRIDHDLALLDAAERLVAAAHAVPVVAVREDDDAPPAGLRADQLQRAHRGVEERGAAPRHQRLHGRGAQRGVALALGQHEHRL